MGTDFDREDVDPTTMDRLDGERDEHQFDPRLHVVTYVTPLHAKCSCGMRMGAPTTDQLDEMVEDHWDAQRPWHDRHRWTVFVLALVSGYVIGNLFRILYLGGSWAWPWEMWSR